MFYAVKTGEPDYFKCACQRCGKRIEFPSNGVGVTVACPHCGKQTVLGVATGSPATKSKRILWVAASGLISVVLAVGLWAFLRIPKPSPTAPTAVAPIPKPAVAPVAPAVVPVTPTATPAVSANKAPAPDKLPAVEKPATPAETIDDFSVGKITLQKTQGSSLVYAVGTAKNATDRQRFGVKIQLNLLDEQERNIGVVSDYVSVVEPHKDWQFKALLMPTQTKVAKVTVADIKEQQ